MLCPTRVGRKALEGHSASAQHGFGLTAQVHVPPLSLHQSSFF
jgi:hypothetical protein